MCRSLEFGKTEKNCTEKLNFLRKNLWELLDAIVLHIFEISAKLRFFWNTAHPISKKFFSTLGAVFLEVKSSNKKETDQCFKKRFFINWSSDFKAESKSHEAKWSRKITGPYCTRQHGTWILLLQYNSSLKTTFVHFSCNPPVWVSC
jgi:hypothetical protein